MRTNALASTSELPTTRALRRISGSRCPTPVSRRYAAACSTHQSDQKQRKVAMRTPASCIAHCRSEALCSQNTGPMRASVSAFAASRGISSTTTASGGREDIASHDLAVMHAPRRHDGQGTRLGRHPGATRGLSVPLVLRDLGRARGEQLARRDEPMHGAPPPVLQDLLTLTQVMG